MCRFVNHYPIRFGYFSRLKFDTCKMEVLKIDRTKLKTVTNYAKEISVTRQTVYNMAKEGRLKIVVIDGVQFVQS